MIQEILTYLILSIAFGYFFYGIYRFFVPKMNASACGGCASCDIKKELASRANGINKINKPLQIQRMEKI